MPGRLRRMAMTAMTAAVLAVALPAYGIAQPAKADATGDPNTGDDTANTYANKPDLFDNAKHHPLGR